ncbi:uncharacterized protein TNCV_3394321 [Trichonephila clavipes]|nr:uncharacterized protein TNCV_3394321 [Trichonephila clavipes]
MQLLTGIVLLDSRRDKFYERARRVDCRYWDEYRCATQRLKTQTSPLSHAKLLMKKHQVPLLMTRRAPIPFYSAVTTAGPSKPRSIINMISNKADIIPEVLKYFTLETIEQIYPANEWLHIYTDDTYLPGTKEAGTGWFFRLFDTSLTVRQNDIN